MHPRYSFVQPLIRPVLELLNVESRYASPHGAVDEQQMNVALFKCSHEPRKKVFISLCNVHAYIKYVIQKLQYIITTYYMHQYILYLYDNEVWHIHR